MDALNSYGLASGVILGVLSAAFTFFNRERFKTLITIYQQGNDELQRQLSNLREESNEKDKEITEYRTKYEQQNKYIDSLERLNLRLPDFAELSKLISNNHTQVVGQLTDLTKIIVEHGNGKLTQKRVRSRKPSS